MNIQETLSVLVWWRVMNSSEAGNGNWFLMRRRIQLWIFITPDEVLPWNSDSYELLLSDLILIDLYFIFYCNFSDSTPPGFRCSEQQPPAEWQEENRVCAAAVWGLQCSLLLLYPIHSYINLDTSTCNWLL